MAFRRNNPRFSTAAPTGAEALAARDMSRRSAVQSPFGQSFNTLNNGRPGQRVVASSSTSAIAKKLGSVATVGLSHERREISQHRNANQPITGSSTDRPISIDDDNDEEPPSRNLTAKYGQTPAQSSSSIGPQVTASEHKSPPRLTLVESSVVPSRDRKRKHSEEHRLAGPSHISNGKRPEEPSYAFSDDESNDPLDVLEPSASESAAPVSPPKVASQMKPANRMAQLGKTFPSTLTMGPHPAKRPKEDPKASSTLAEASSSSVSFSRDANPKAQCFPLVSFIVGELDGVGGDASPKLSFTNKASSTRFDVEWTESSRTQTIQFDASEITAVRIERKPQVDEIVLLEMHLRSNSTSARQIKGRCNGYDITTDQTAIICQARLFKSTKDSWEQFASWFKKAAGGGCDWRIIDHSAGKAIFSTYESVVQQSAARRRRDKAQEAQKDLRQDSTLDLTSDVPATTSTKTLSNRKSPDATRGVNTRADNRSSNATTFTASTRPRPTPRVAEAPPPRQTRLATSSARNDDSLLDSPEESSKRQAKLPARTSDELLLQYPLDGPGRVSIFESDEDRLRDGEFLNDTIIEFGLKHRLLKLRDTNPSLYDSIYLFNTFFYRQLTKSKRHDENYAQVRKWTNKIDIFSKKFIVIPINENLHWYLALVLNPGKVLTQRKESAVKNLGSPSSTATPEHRPSENASGLLPDEIDRSCSKANITVDLDLSDEDIADPQPPKAASVIALSDAESHMERSYSQLNIGGPKESTPPPKASETHAMQLDTPNGTSEQLTTGSAAVKEATSLPSTQTAFLPEGLNDYVLQSLDGIPSSPIANGENVSKLLDDGNDDVDIVDGSSNVDNAGQGKLVGGGSLQPNDTASSSSQPKKAPMRIVPGESLSKQRNTSPDGLVSAVKPPKPRQQQQYGSNKGKGRADPTAAASTASFYGTRGAGATTASPTQSFTSPTQTRAKAAVKKRDEIDLCDIDDGNSSTGSQAPVGPKRRQPAAPARQAPERQPSARQESALTKNRARLEEVVVLTFDSLGSKHTSVRTTVKHYLQNEARDKKRVNLDFKDMEIDYIDVAVPGQSNWCDCGLYVLLCEYKDPLQSRKDRASMKTDASF